MSTVEFNGTNIVYTLEDSHQARELAHHLTDIAAKTNDAGWREDAEAAALDEHR